MIDRPAGDLGVNEIIKQLNMKSHPEGGWYVETYRDGSEGKRARSTSIYFLLAADQVSAWHKIDAVEYWLWHCGAPLVLTLSLDGKSAYTCHLGPDLRAGHRPQCIIPQNAWQTAESLGSWSLVSCIVAPGFEFSGFEMAPKDWRPDIPDL